jgi:ribosomal-protein-alanine N-acetyltransferase
MKADIAHKIVTDRLLLRPFTLEDAPAMFQWASDKEVTQYLRFERHTTIEESKKIILSWIENDLFPQFCNWAIVVKDSNTVIGSVGLMTLSALDNKGEVGYCLTRNEWGKGYMSEALPYVLKYGFSHMNLHRIEAAHSINNIASGRVMEKAHMVKECDCLRHYYKSSSSGYQDSALYAAFSDTYDLPKIQ